MFIGIGRVHGKLVYALNGSMAVTSDYAKAGLFATAEQAMRQIDLATDGRGIDADQLDDYEPHAVSWLASLSREQYEEYRAGVERQSELLLGC